MIEFIEDINKGFVIEVEGLQAAEGRWAVSGFIDGDRNRYFRIDIPKNIEDKRELLEFFCKELSELFKVAGGSKA